MIINNLTEPNHNTELNIYVGCAISYKNSSVPQETYIRAFSELFILARTKFILEGWRWIGGFANSKRIKWNGRRVCDFQRNVEWDVRVIYINLTFDPSAYSVVKFTDILVRLCCALFNYLRMWFTWKIESLIWAGKIKDFRLIYRTMQKYIML